ncbi:MAG: hypothetical protein ABI887_02925 [Burkholderiales bacterium]
MNLNRPFRPAILIAAAALALAAALPLSAAAQDYAGMLRQSQMRSNLLTMQINQARAQAVNRKAQDPEVRARYAQYVQNMRSRGMPAMNFFQYAEEYMFTRGFSRDGIAYARNVNAGIQAREQASVRAYRDAQAARGQAMQQQRDAYFRNQQEAGRGLMGQSTYHGPNGYQTQLPHTWQNNTQHHYQGQTYRVTESGQYQVLGTNGWWQPINR